MMLKRLFFRSRVHLGTVVAVVAALLVGAMASVSGAAGTLQQMSQCGDVTFVAAMGSGQSYRAPADLSPSPQLSAAQRAFHTRITAVNLHDTVQVLNYPALSVNVLSENLQWNPRPLDTLFKVNLPKYMAGKDAGVAALWAAFNGIRSSCPTEKIVLAGYSQGSMVVHQFLNQLAKRNDRAGQSAIRSVILLADPDRVRHSGVVDFGDAPYGSYGICDAASLVVSCMAPDRLSDIPAAFRNRSLAVCFNLDPVCDTSDVAHDLVVNTGAGRAELLKLLGAIHGSYSYAFQTRLAGTRAAQLAAAR